MNWLALLESEQLCFWVRTLRSRTHSHQHPHYPTKGVRTIIHVIEYVRNLVNCFVYIVLPRPNPRCKDRQRVARLIIEANNTAEVVCTVAW